MRTGSEAHVAERKMYVVEEYELKSESRGGAAARLRWLKRLIVGE